MRGRAARPASVLNSRRNRQLGPISQTLTVLERQDLQLACDGLRFAVLLLIFFAAHQLGAGFVPVRKLAAKVEGIYAAPHGRFQTEAVDELALGFDGIFGDFHAGPTRRSRSPCPAKPISWPKRPPSACR